MRRVLKFCILLTAVISLSLQNGSFISRAYGEDFTPQQRLAIVLEGIQTPQEIIDICSENGISVETYNEWKSTLLSSADQIYGDPTERAVEVQEREGLSVRPSTKIIGLGSDVFSEDTSDLTEDKWKIHTSFKLWLAKWSEKEVFGQWSAGVFRDTRVMGGPAISFSKGDHAISLSVLAPSGKFEDSRDELKDESTSVYYIGDIRYHTSVNENLSWFIGYKVGYDGWEGEYYNHEPGDAYGVLNFEGDGHCWSHGITLGSNISIPIETPGPPLSVWSSFALAPLVVEHETDNDWLNGVERHWAKSNFDSWYMNPEIGIRTNVTENSSFNLSYRYDVWGDYHTGSWVTLGGPSLTYSIKW